MPSFNPAKTPYSRVFIIEGQAQPDHEPQYQSCLKAGALSQGFGDVTDIKCPSPIEYGHFETVGRIQGAIERAATSLTGRYAADLASELLRIGKLRCAVDVQVHFGACTDPRVFNTFTKDIVLEDVFLTNWTTEDLGALSDDESASIDEGTDISIGNVDEVLWLSLQERADILVENEIVDVVICDRITCGECEEFSEGCEKIYALSGGIAGSPGTPPDVIYSLDGGKTWALDEINSLHPDEAGSALACVGEYLVVVSNASASLHWKLRVDVDNGVAGGWTEVTAGFVAGHAPRDIWSVGVGAYISADNGYVYWTSDPTSGVSVLDAAIATGGVLYAVHALDDEFAVAVEAGDNIIWTNNRINWQIATPTGSGDALMGVWIKNESEWWVVSDAGEVYYTLDGGVSWTLKPLPGNVNHLYDVAFASDSVAYICGDYNKDARAWRSYDGGFSWNALPEGVGNLPVDARDMNALAACVNDVNFLVLVGEGVTTNGNVDGIIVVGED